jgi:hypothetical protein
MAHGHTDRLHRVFDIDHPYKIQSSPYYYADPGASPEGIICGPKLEDLVDFCQYDQYSYKAEPLRSRMIRLMIASAAFSVLRYADHYDVVIGEDTSGRFPALIVGGAINDVRRAHGLEPARRLFLSGRIDNRHYRPTWRIDEKDQPLVVTEHVEGGYSTENVAITLQEQTRQPIDFVTIGGYPEMTARRHRNPNVSTSSTVFTGDLRRFARQVDDHLSFGESIQWKGVQKRFGDPHSRLPSPPEDAELIAASRIEAKILRTAISGYFLAIEAEQPE